MYKPVFRQSPYKTGKKNPTITPLLGTSFFKQQIKEITVFCKADINNNVSYFYTEIFVSLHWASFGAASKNAGTSVQRLRKQQHSVANTEHAFTELTKTVDAYLTKAHKEESSFDSHCNFTRLTFLALKSKISYSVFWKTYSQLSRTGVERVFVCFVEKHASSPILFKIIMI